MLTHPPLIPAKAGIQDLALWPLGPRFRGDERRECGLNFVALACLAAALLLGIAGSAQAELRSYQIVGDAIPEPLTGAPGDPAKGRAIVGNRQVGLCLLCHTGPFPEERFQGTLAPDLGGAGTRWSPGQLRLRIVDSTRINPATIMPPYYRTDGLLRVAPGFVGKPVLNAEQIEDVIAYLSTLRD
jgi:sulfur-oxidizing protein SoxX